MQIQPLAPNADRSTAKILVLRIWKDHVPIKNSAALKEVVRCEYAKIGGASGGMTTVQNISLLRQAPHLWSVIEPAYNAWLKGQEPPVDGTPLDAWSAITKGQIDHFRLLNIRSVEDIAGCDEPTLERMGMGSRALRDTARQYIAAATNGEAHLAAAIGKKDAEIAELQGTVADMKQSIEQLTVNAKASQPKRGRPRKEPVSSVASAGTAADPGVQVEVMSNFGVVEADNSPRRTGNLDTRRR